MNYTIKWCEVKKSGTTNGKPWAITSMTLVDETGVETANVDTFDKVQNGGTIIGEIREGKYGKEFLAKKEEKPKNAYREQQMEKTMARKEESIGKFQDNKEWSIKVASTMNKAVELAVAEYAATQGVVLTARILWWRKFLWDNWNVDLGDTDAITGNIL